MAKKHFHRCKFTGAAVADINPSTAKGKYYIKQKSEWGIKEKQGPAITEQTMSKFLELRLQLGQELDL